MLTMRSLIYLLPLLVSGVSSSTLRYNAKADNHVELRGGRRTQSGTICSVCPTGAVMETTSSEVPAGTLSWLPNETISCFRLEVLAQSGFLNATQCSEFATTDASTLCGCSSPSTNSTPTTPVAAPVPAPVPAPTEPSLVRTTGSVLIRLQSVSIQMSPSIEEAYNGVLTSFFDYFLNQGSSTFDNVTAITKEQTLITGDTSKRHRILLESRFLQNSTGLLPLDTLVDVEGLVPAGSADASSLNQQLTEIITIHSNDLISRLQSQEGTVNSFYFNNVETITSSDPNGPAPTPQQPPAEAPVAAPAPAPTPRAGENDDGLSAGAIAGISIGGMFVLAVAVMFFSRYFQNKPTVGSHVFNRQESIALDHHTDPFAQREGKTLLWTNVNMTLTASGDEPDRELLRDVWGEVPAKETTAIMGPSGAGKSSLLNILAGRASSRGRIRISSDIRLNNVVVDPSKIEVRRKIAFVAQDDSLQVTATPRESIRFSAKLRLSRDVTDAALDKLTQRVITELGLTSCADTIVGGALIKGISGGERKRTSVGVELVVKPTLIFLDEPTSGLDSFSAVQLCQVLKKVANSGASVLFTIHQPSSEIFNSFDRLILMNKGRVMYQGSVFDVPKYFGDRGHPNPPNYNPADWVMQVAQSVKIKELDDAGFFPKDDREIGDAFEPDEGRDALGITITKREKNSKDTDYAAPPPGLGTQISMLFTRELNNLGRDTAAVGARFGLTIFLGTLIGTIFLNVGETDSSVPSNINSHFGALIMVMLMSMFGTAQPALLAFPEERPVFLREFSTNHYSVISYFASRFTMEAFITALQILVMVIITYFMIGFQSNFGMFYVVVYSLAMASTALAVLLGCSVEDPKLGQEMLPILFVPQMLFAGFFVRPELIPIWLRWAQYLCTLTYAVRIMLVAEFEGCSNDLSNPGAAKQCTGLLDGVSADPDNTWWYWLVLVALFAVFRLGALMVLKSKATKFL